MAGAVEEKYLRVLTPQTVDGINLKYDERTERVIRKETFLPLTAKKHLEAENETLPIQLRHTIEVVDGSVKQEIKGSKPAVAISPTEKVKGKPGPKPKEKTVEEPDPEEVAKPE
jgi:hypothetical protein